jgi:DNA-binding response OmpR family regulator
MAVASTNSRPLGGDAVTVMIVEPDVVVRTVIAEYLRECGYKVIEGASAEDVWKVLEDNILIDVVLADIQLTGGGDGFSLARRLREQYPAIDVLLTSGAAKVADKAGELCEDGPLEKPYHPQDVLRRIHLMHERRRTETQSNKSKS